MRPITNGSRVCLTYNLSLADKGKKTEASVPELVQNQARQLSDVACYLVNLADDLQRWLVHGSIDPEMLPQVREAA